MAKYNKRYRKLHIKLNKNEKRETLTLFLHRSTPVDRPHKYEQRIFLAVAGINYAFEREWTVWFVIDRKSKLTLSRQKYIYQYMYT